MFVVFTLLCRWVLAFGRNTLAENSVPTLVLPGQLLMLLMQEVNLWVPTSKNHSNTDCLASAKGFPDRIAQNLKNLMNPSDCSTKRVTSKATIVNGSDEPADSHVPT